MGILREGHSMPQMPQLITSLLALRTAQNVCAPADGGVGQKSHLGEIQQDSGSLGFPPAASDSLPVRSSQGGADTGHDAMTRWHQG